MTGSAAAAGAADARAWAGLWDATVVVNGLEVPFRFEIAATGRQDATTGAAPLRGSFFDGERKVSSTQASLNGDALSLRFDQYLAVLDVTLTDGRLEGQYSRGSRSVYPFKASRAAASSSSSSRKLKSTHAGFPSPASGGYY